MSAWGRYEWQGVRVYVCFRHFHTALKTLPLAAPWAKNKGKIWHQSLSGFSIQWAIIRAVGLIQTEGSRIISGSNYIMHWEVSGLDEFVLGCSKGCHPFLFAQKRPLVWLICMFIFQAFSSTRCKKWHQLYKQSWWICFPRMIPSYLVQSRAEFSPFTMLRSRHIRSRRGEAC